MPHLDFQRRQVREVGTDPLALDKGRTVGGDLTESFTSRFRAGRDSLQKLEVVLVGLADCPLLAGVASA